LNQNYNIEPNLLQLIDSDQAYHYNIVPCHADNSTITFKSDRVSDSLKDELEIVLNKNVELVSETSEQKILGAVISILSLMKRVVEFVFVWMES